MAQPTKLQIARMTSHEGRRVLITGASLGIGREVARLFAAEGAVVAMHYSRQIDEMTGYAGAAAALVNDLQALSPDSAGLDVDLSAPGSGALLVERANEILGGVDVLVICASTQIRERFGAVTAESIARHARVNFEASVEMLQAALGPMAAAGWGRVISIGSLNQFRPDPELAVYAAMKAAHHNLIRNLAKVHAADGITLNTVSPGLISTPRNAWRRENPHEWHEIEHKANPMHRAGIPEEVAHMVLLLTSDAGAFTTGADIPVDGGAHL
ncbi:SDR family NAD(P)-dependent oxidoreductase [Paraburkholderia sp. UCT2]|uniref:SDR family NAD(P)-dependent oxidoreductase n=1 Tax=Paraburkholderia sp. UCT2 TaxID=2615208 RepID=UPI001655B65D|nr:SDR family oxidoreductase [Paraburkholderia sp. UCT2]MBC8733505.1 SDR family oxidoreductase [Paraburkholderia sp. UCT2]